MTESVTYAYAVLRVTEGLGVALGGVEGVAGASVRLVPQDSGSELAAAVSSVPAEDFQESALRCHLEDLDWLETVARAHHAVIEALAAHTTVLPLRLATVYLDDKRVGTVLREEADEFSQALRRLAGHLEWGVKIYAEPQPDTQATREAGAAGTADGLSPGRAYLRARRSQRHSRDEAYRAALQAAERVEAIGHTMAAGHARHRVQQGELAADAGENVVNDAYLLPREAAADFRIQVLDAARGLPGVRIDVTGPWAPYSFAAPPGTQTSATDRTS
ncbi:GvpL/GvpF family gas vesicle protein [Streptomyces sp. MMG1121]|uniref:GvpL/GvpF family gas vesicle protein n=1 Tax=Streptomyces sp. MMG1121 TaxID=1415544 RepID=UPI0006AF4F5F|nr:GvpL/GvpF family gas vesicle protein [Streptomyces sp. MMG1121]KOV58081.1 gas vesicle protein [Streptomyces sp. MMG1121]